MDISQIAITRVHGCLVANIQVDLTPEVREVLRDSLLQRLEHTKAVAGVEGVGRAGHRLDREAVAPAVRRERVTGEDHDVAEGLAHPERRRGGGPLQGAGAGE